MTMTAENPVAHETLRKANLKTLATLLESQRVRTSDLAITGHRLAVHNGNLIVSGVGPQTDITPDGVTTTDVNGTYAFGDIGVESLATRLNLPTAHLRTWRNQHPDLFDDTVNYFLRGLYRDGISEHASPDTRDGISEHASPDTRVHTLRLLTAAEPGSDVTGMVRAVLGSTYQALDSVDALVAVVEGMAAAGLTPDRCKIEADLTESRMVLKVWVPEIAVLAPALLGNYRSPFTGQSGSDVPQVFAGLVFSNSEVGRGRWNITPRIVFKVCSNGQTITKDAFSKTHAGGALEEGVIKWSRATQLANLELIKNKTADAARTFLDIDYVTTKVAELEKTAGTRVKTGPEETIAKVTKHTGHTSVRSSILQMFMQGADFTAGGVMNAYTAAAQDVSAETAFSLENAAIGAMEWTAAANR